MVVSRMVQDVWGMTTIDMITCQLDVMGLGLPQPSSTVTISEMPTETPTLEDASDSEDCMQVQPPPFGFTGINTMFPHHWQLSALILHRTVLYEVFLPNRIVNML